MISIVSIVLPLSLLMCLKASRFACNYRHYISKITFCFWCLVQACTSLYKTKKTGRRKTKKPGFLRHKTTSNSLIITKHKMTRTSQGHARPHKTARAAINARRLKYWFPRKMYCMYKVVKRKLISAEACSLQLCWAAALNINVTRGLCVSA